MRFLFLITLLIASSCSTPNWYKPYGYMMFKKIPKNGSPGLKLGWQHGCQSGLATNFGGGIYMYFYTWSRDIDIASSNPDIEKIKRRYKKELAKVNWDNPADVSKNLSDYNTIFWNSYGFCKASVLGILRTGGAGMTPKLPGQARYVLGEEDIGSVWRLDGKGDARIGTGNW
jgi:hypothetical protein